MGVAGSISGVDVESLQLAEHKANFIGSSSQDNRIPGDGPAVKQTLELSALQGWLEPYALEPAGLSVERCRLSLEAGHPKCCYSQGFMKDKLSVWIMCGWLLPSV